PRRSRDASIVHFRLQLRLYGEVKMPLDKQKEGTEGHQYADTSESALGTQMIAADLFGLRFYIVRSDLSLRRRIGIVFHSSKWQFTLKIQACCSSCLLLCIASSV